MDGDVGFGVAPLRAHVRQCPECQARVDEARVIVDALEELPHFAPSSVFAERVMQQVHVFEPWHVAARNSVRRLVPHSTPARIAAAVMGVAATTVLAVASLWIGMRLDMLTVFSGTAIQRGREIVASAIEGVVGAAFGPAALAVVRAMGAAGLLVATIILAVAATGAVIGVRRLATASSRRAGGQ
ncbi:MAG: hypothetical protein HOQ11_04490 [Gemmatimonadaceae bacterium]|nr:hypothetical protein [Gemmatimonadaceae bacterium]NUS96649.1 hypothetical protein [Gemmatimonadaceae bacterium]